MEELRAKLIQQFLEGFNAIDLSLDPSRITLKYNSLTENILETLLIQKEKEEEKKKEHTQTIAQNTPKPQDTCIEGSLDYMVNISSSGKSFDTLLEPENNSPSHLRSLKNAVLEEPSTIPKNFMLTEEMKQFAKLKFVKNIEDVFEEFTFYYQGKGNCNKDWEAVWKKWVLSNSKFTNHLPRTPLDHDIVLSQTMQSIAKKYLKEEAIELEFTKFKNYYISTGDLKSSWVKVWENWCIKHKEFQPKVLKEQSSKQKEKADYKWDFRKVKDTSDKIKNWLEFDAKIDWMTDYYWKNIQRFTIKTKSSSLQLGWKKMPHPDFNKDEILLFRIDTNEAKYLLEENIDTVEVIEND